MHYADALDWLYSRQRFGIKMGLENMRALLDRLEKPEESFGAIHVAGTNGKGSTCAMIESALRAGGHRVGLYTSPHLVSFRERIRVDGREISREDVAGAATRVRPVVDELDARRVNPTFFECVTALAFEHFRRVRVPLVIVEAGLGGRLDATNLCRPLTSIITNVGLDHTEQLGTSIQAIAKEKAGILREGVPAFTGARREALDVIAKEATARKAPLKVVRAGSPIASTLEGSRFRHTFLGEPLEFQLRLLGDHQVENAALALAALEAIKAQAPVSADQAAKGLADATWPGRLEIVDRDPLTLLDGAHNAPAIETVCAFLKAHFAGQPIAACVGVLRDKAASRILAQLMEHVTRVILTEPPSARALSAAELAEALPPGAPEPTLVPDPREAFRALLTEGDEPVRLITGSLFLVGEARAQLLRLERDPKPATPRVQ